MLWFFWYDSCILLCYDTNVMFRLLCYVWLHCYDLFVKFIQFVYLDKKKLRQKDENLERWKVYPDRKVQWRWKVELQFLRLLCNNRSHPFPSELLPRLSIERNSTNRDILKNRLLQGLLKKHMKNGIKSHSLKVDRLDPT